ncbi:MAG: glycosyltransferase family 9 protein, partial [Anaerolineales bacterium]|nr:glycosyltransferase family 9 protein [Anaerolineales bacterium]
LILLPCCLSRVMLATPLLAVISKSFPRAQLDWAISDEARPAIAGNPRLTELIRTGHGNLHDAKVGTLRDLVQRIREESYDTCITPSRSSLLAWIAWQAQIPQRIGLSAGGRGFAHTLPVKAPAGEQHEAVVYLEIARALGIEAGMGERLPMEFYPQDSARTAVTQRLIDELDWLGDRPLVIMHPGGGDGAFAVDPRKQWPLERFVLLGNEIVRRYGAQILLVGGPQDYDSAQAIAGMMFAPVGNWAGKVSLGEVGALAEMANLYIGNDTGPTHIAAAVGCATIAIFGPSDPAISAPYGRGDRVIAVRMGGEKRPFTWEDGVGVDGVITAVAKLMK